MYTLVMSKRKSNLYELQAIQVVKSLLGCSSLSILQNNFKSEIEKLPRRGVSTVENYYKMVLNETQTQLQLWHKDSIGNLDRMILSISK